MSENMTDLRTRLEELADAPAPASTFDPVQVAATGRRRVLAARASAFGGGGALAVAAVFGIVAAFGPAAPSAAAPEAGYGGDPVVRLIGFGWLPASLSNVSYASESKVRDSDVAAEGDMTSGAAPRVDLQLLPRNGPGTPNAHERLIPTTLNDGRKAYWLTQSPSGGQFAGEFELRFPVKDGRWASLSWGVDGDQRKAEKIGGVPVPNGSTPPTSVPVSAEWQQTLLRIATQVTDTPAKIPMPLRVTGLPAEFKPDSAFMWRPGFGAPPQGPWSAIVEFVSGDSSINIDVGVHGTLQDSGSVCMTEAGLDACVWSTGHSPELDRLGGAKGVLKHLTLLGIDEKHWTTDVLVP